MIENWQRAGFGLYLHWPFCEAKCPYCDFNSHVVGSVDYDAWRSVLLSEIDRYGVELPGRTLTSIYFGGGTPSLMPPSLVSDLINRIAATWTVSNSVEITLEANPSSIEVERFKGFKSAGVNRVSVGVQALNDPDLRRLGRIHSAREAEKALDAVSASFDRFSFDLIYARQNQTIEEWEAELSKAIGFGANHMSLYQLTVEPETVFGRRHALGQLRGLPDEDQAADMFELTQSMCNAADLPAYEVSNHARSGQESVHNQIYWGSGDYVGIGPGAHGRLTVDSKRIATSTLLGPQPWLNNVSGGREARSYISVEDQLSEFLMMGLRTKSGVSIDALNSLKFSNWTQVQAFKKVGLISEDQGHLRATAQGRMLLNAVLRDLLV